MNKMLKNPCKICTKNKKQFVKDVKEILFQRVDFTKKHPAWNKDMIKGFECATIMIHYAINKFVEK